jgi:heme/copper-type cytochrome/quinol oxidase subunit 2
MFGGFSLFQIGSVMNKLLAAALPFLYTAAAFAAEEAEPPVEGNMTGVIVFLIACVACVALYVWYTMKGEKQSETEKQGDKF